MLIDYMNLTGFCFKTIEYLGVELGENAQTGKSLALYFLGLSYLGLGTAWKVFNWELHEINKPIFQAYVYR